MLSPQSRDAKRLFALGRMPTVEALAPYVSDLQRRWLADDPRRLWRAEPGSLLFLDVSGFTPLTERLARRGKIGGEELTDHLNTVFTTLIDVAQARGGDCLKFGGDALLLHFEGVGHEQRAAAAAWEVQAAMRRFRRLRTSQGVAELRASAGVASGPVHVFCVGGAWRDLVVAGPTTTLALKAEAFADAGEVLVAPATAAALDQPSLGVVRGDAGTLLQARPSAPSPPPVRRPSVDPLRALPAEIAPYLAVATDGEHRQSTVAFLQFRGVDELLATAGAEAAATALDELVTAVQATCARRRITYLDSDADAGAGKLFLCTGSPVADDDDEERMLLGLREVLSRPSALALRAGVNRGRVFAVALGAPHRRTYTTMGDTTNLAARVMGHAPPGGLLATQPLLDRVRAPLRLAPVAPFRVKGKSELVAASIVGDADDAVTTAPARSAAVAIVGREREREVLRGALGGGVVELAGDPGIGKSALVAELLGAAGDAVVLRVDGLAYHANTPFGALRRPLAALLAGGEARLRELAGSEAEPWLSLAGVPFGIDLPPSDAVSRLEPEPARQRRRLLCGDVLEQLLPRGALVAIEDAHWLDSGSADLLLAVAERAARCGWAVVATRREVDGGLRFEGDDVQWLRLAPLGAQVARALAFGDVEHDATPLPPAIVAALVERAGGNPLFLRELVDAARGGGAVAELPDSVEALLGARIDTLAPGDREELRRAAVLGTEFGRPLLEAMLEQPPAATTATLERLGGFLEPGNGRVRFRHALVREAAYEALSYRRRRALHGRAGRIVEGLAGDALDEHVALLSLHYDVAGDSQRSWRFSREAGEQAMRRGAPAEATVFFARALRAGRGVDDAATSDMIDVAEALGDAADLAGLYPAAADAYRTARRLAAGDDVRLARLCRKEGVLREHSSTYSQALRWYTRGLRHVERVEPGEGAERLRANLILARGAAILRQGRLAESIAPLEAAAAAARQLDDRPALAHASYLLDWACTDLGRPEEQHRVTALEIYEQLEDFVGLGNVLNNLGINAYYEGDWDGAIALYERCRAAREQAGDVVRLAEPANNIGEVRSDQGRYDEAEAALRDALALWRAAAFPAGAGHATSNLGRLAARRGDDDRAMALLTRAVSELDAIGAGALAAEARARLAEAHVLAGRAGDALEAVAVARAGTIPVIVALLERVAGWAHLLNDDAAAAVASLDASLAAARHAGAPFEEAVTLDTLHVVGGDEANRERADEILQGLGVVHVPRPRL